MSLLKFQFKLTNGKLPDYFPHIFTYEEVEYGYDFRNPHSLIFPSTRTFSAEDSILKILFAYFHVVNASVNYR